MACIVNFTLGGKDKNVEYTFSDFNNNGDNTIEYILSLIYKNYKDNKESWNELKKSLVEKNYQVNEITEVMKKQLEEKAIFPYNFNSDSFVKGTNKKVLLVRGIKSLANINFNFGTKVVLNGKEEIFIVKNTKDGLTRFKNYIKLEKILSEGKFEPNDTDNRVLEIINKNKKKKFKSFNELVLDFITNKAHYQKNYSDIYVYLDDFCNSLLGNLLTTKFSNDILNTIYAISRISNYGNTLSLKVSELSGIITRLSITLLDTDSKLILKDLDPSKFKQVKDDENSLNFEDYYIQPLSKIKDDIFNGLPLWQRLGLTEEETEKWKNHGVLSILIKRITDLDPNFEFKFKEARNGIIFLNKDSKKFGKRFGYDFQTIQTFTVLKPYKNYLIFKYIDDGVEKYFTSKSVLHTDLSDVKVYNSREEAQRFIDLNLFSKSRIDTDTLLFRKIYGLHRGVKYVKNGNITIPDSLYNNMVGNIYRILQLPKLGNYYLNTNEINFIDLDKTVNDFFKDFIYKNWNLDPEKDGALIRLMRQQLDDPLKIIALFYLTQTIKDKTSLKNSIEEIIDNEELNIDKIKQSLIELINLEVSKSNLRDTLIENINNKIDKTDLKTSLFKLVDSYLYLYDEVKDKSLLKNVLIQISKLGYDFYKPLNTNAYIKIDKLVDIDSDSKLISEFYNTRHALDLFKFKILSLSQRIKINIVTSDLLKNDEEIGTLIPDIKRRAKEIKGFVHNDLIYINADTANLEDMAHEYFHIVLAAFKTKFKTDNLYYEFLDKFKELVETNDNVKAIYNELKRNPTYRKFSDYDILEETLARCFGEHIQKGDIFSDDFINSLYISTAKFSEIINSTNLTLEELFLKLNVLELFDKIKELFPTKSLSYILQRKVTNFISKKLGKEIIEDCE